MRIVLDLLIPAEENGLYMADGFGRVRFCFPRIGAYMCDYPEQCLVLTIQDKTSPTFQATVKNLGDPTPGPLQDYDSIMDVIKDLHVAFGKGDDQVGIGECMKAAKEAGFIGVLYPWWEHHVGIQLWRVIAPNILHGLHKFFCDHPFKWIKHLVGKKEYDRHLASLQPLVGIRHFTQGVGHLHQLMGREDRELQRTALTIAYGASKVTPNALRALCAICDTIQVLQYESHDSETLEYITKFISKFHKYKQVFIDMGV
jgi:hypothetical protein